MVAETLREILEHAGIAINGPNPWDIHVRDDRWYARVWREKSLGLGESYMDGWWDCERVDQMTCRLVRSSFGEKVKGSPRYLTSFLQGYL